MKIKVLTLLLLLSVLGIFAPSVSAQGSLRISIVRVVPATCNYIANPVVYKLPATTIDTTGGLYECNPSTSTYAQLAPQVGSLTANTFIYANATPAVTSTTSLFYPAFATNYSSASSFQPISIDFTLAAGAGKNVGVGTSYLAPIMGNIFNAAPLTKTGNYLGGVIGAYSITGTRATTYPAGAVLGQITDGVTEADGAFVAFIDGDSAQTNAVAGLSFLNNNSTAASGFDWAINAYGAAHDGFNAVAFKKGFARIAVNAAPGTPPASSLATWADTTDKRWHDKNDAGTIGTTVVADTGSANNFLTAVSAAGVISKAQPAAANLSNGVTGSGAVVLTNTPTLITPVLGTATATSVTVTNGPLLNEGRLSTIAAVNMNTATATVLYTSPTGLSTLITKVVVRNCSTSMTTASYSFGWEAVTFANVIANATHTELTGATLYTRLNAKTGATVGTSTGTFNVLLNTLQGGAATCTIDVFGYTF